MKKKIIAAPLILLSFILIIFFYLLIIDRNPSEIPSNLLNKKVPTFETETLLKNKKFISPEEFENQLTLVNFFATWCKPCRDEHPYIKKFSEKDKIRIIGINYKDKSEKTKNWLNTLGNPYSYIALDENGQIGINWGVYGLPETFIVDAKGYIRYRHVGPITKKVYKKINLIIKEYK